MENSENEIGAPSMYQTTKIWYEAKDLEEWGNIYKSYREDMLTKDDFMFFVDWLKENYEAPKKK